MKIIANVLISLLVFIALPSQSFSQVESKPLVKIGVIAPLSGSTAGYGEDPVKVLKLYEQSLENKQHRYKFIYEDGRCGEGSSAVSAAQKLISVDQVKFLVLGCSGEVMQVAPLAEKNQVVAIGYAASHPEIKRLGDFIFRTYADMEQGVTLLISHMKKAGTKKMVLLSEDNAFNAGIKKLFESHAADLIEFNEAFKVDESDFRTLIIKAKQSNAPVWYLNAASPKSYQNLFRQIRELGVKAKLYSYHQPLDPSSLQALGSQQDGIVILAVPEAHGSNELFDTLMQKFKQSKPEGPTIEILTRSAFDAAQALVSGIEAVGLESQLVKNFLYTYHTQGALGDVSFDAHGDINGLAYVLKTIQEGKPTSVID